ncbi:MAG: GntR family transcriptional regulator [Syntrophobacteraceae bacterium]|jgi:DNA-binding GntR family transcriptional regulator
METEAETRPKRVARPKTDSNTLIEDAYRSIKQLIFDQKFVPGQKLVYDDLARMLNMSRTPVINALNRLEQQGLVVSESRRGFYVRPMDLGEAWDAFGVREALETYAVETAILKAGEEDYAKLEEKLREYENYNPPYYNRKKIFLDAAYHLQLAEMTKNKILKWHLKINLEHIYLRARLDNYDPARMEEALAEHHMLVRKMKNKDVKGSIETIRKHIHGARSHVLACLSDNELKTAGFEL